MLNVRHNAVFGLIPARGGSKSVPLKNLAPLAGRPLLQYRIESAKSVMPSAVNRTICSTDHPRTKDVCERFGVDVIDAT